METDRIALFVDVQNLYHCARAAHGDRTHINYRALLEHASSKGRLVLAHAYQARNGTNGKEAGFFTALGLMGYRVVTRPVKVLPDGSIKGNMDVDMAIDAVLQAARYDTAILVTGDGDFSVVADRLAQMGKRVCVVGPNEHTAVELILASQEFLHARQVPGLISGGTVNGAAQANGGAGMPASIEPLELASAR